MASSTSASLVAVWMVWMVAETQLLGGGIGMGLMFSSGVEAPMEAPGAHICASAGLEAWELLEDSASGRPLSGKGVGMWAPKLWGPPRSSSTRE